MNVLDLQQLSWTPYGDFVPSTLSVIDCGTGQSTLSVDSCS